jgi:hypothetical protein
MKVSQIVHFFGKSSKSYNVNSRKKGDDRKHNRYLWPLYLGVWKLLQLVTKEETNNETPKAAQPVVFWVNSLDHDWSIIYGLFQYAF